MSRWAVTGATGLVGRFITEELLARGQEVVVLGRTRPPADHFSGPVAFRPFLLDHPESADVSGCEALVHCAFDHVPGRYRGGEGNDPRGFRRRNIDGSIGLFEAARAAGLARAVFLSTRAVYGAYPAGTMLSEDMTARPDTLYGIAKLTVEEALKALTTEAFATCSLRVTGVYGPAAPGKRHKWADLFEAHLAEDVATPRAATEVHGADLAAAVWLAAQQPGAGLWNVSDLVLERRDLLAEVNRLTGRDLPLPAAQGTGQVSAMSCARLRALGWTPGGMTRLRESLAEMVPHHV